MQGCSCLGPHLLQYNSTTGHAECKYIPPPPWKVLLPLFILGGILVVLFAKETGSLALRSGGQTLYLLGPDKSSPPGVGAVT